MLLSSFVFGCSNQLFTVMEILGPGYIRQLPFRATPIHGGGLDWSLATAITFTRTDHPILRPLFDGHLPILSASFSGTASVQFKMTITAKEDKTNSVACKKNCPNWCAFPHRLKSISARIPSNALLV